MQVYEFDYETVYNHSTTRLCSQALMYVL